MRVSLAICVGFAAALLGAAAPNPAVVAAWKASQVDANKHWAQIPHAILKIQDSAYLRDGETAVLTGDKGKPATYRWSHDAKAKGSLSVNVQGASVVVVKDGKPLDAKLITKSIPVDKDIDVWGQPTQVGAGIPGWRIFVYNQQNPAAKTFKGVSYFPYDPAYRVTAAFKPDPALPARTFRTSRGTDKQFYHAGDATFSLQGKQFTLPFYAESNRASGITDMSAFYTDAQAGNETYGSGRYVDVEGIKTFPPSVLTIDFNDSYNPNCARSPHFTCPLATDDIELAVKAGEKNPHMAR